MLKTYLISNYVQMAGSLAIAVSCLLHFKERSSHIKVLGFYAVVSLLFSTGQQTSLFFFSSLYLNAIGTWSVVSELIFFSMFFYFVTENPKFKRGIVISVITYLIFCLTAVLFFDDRLYSFTRFGRDSIMIVYALVYFSYLVRKLPENNLLRFPLFWINSSIIFFFSGTFILSLMADYIVSVLNTNLTGFWIFRNLFRFMFCACNSICRLARFTNVRF